MRSRGERVNSFIFFFNYTNIRTNIFFFLSRCFKKLEVVDVFRLKPREEIKREIQIAKRTTYGDQLFKIVFSGKAIATIQPDRHK